MEQIKYYFGLYKKQIILTLSFITLLILASISFFIINKKYNSEEIIKEENEITAFLEEKNSKDYRENSNVLIKIDIKGCVKKPGVYELKEDKRVIDAIELAGGLTENAYTEGINLSQKLNDEDVIIIYNKEEYKEENKSTTSGIITKKTETKTTSTTNKTTNSQTNNNSTLNAIVNINTASKESLMTLSGIGESKAEKIIEYRNINGNFKNIEELKNVKGIGDAIYAKIKDKITV